MLWKNCAVYGNKLSKIFIYIYSGTFWLLRNETCGIEKNEPLYLCMKLPTVYKIKSTEQKQKRKKKASKTSYLRYKAVRRVRFKREITLKFILNLINKVYKVFG